MPVVGAAKEKATVDPGSEKKSKEKAPAAPAKGGKKTKKILMPPSHLDYLESVVLDKGEPLLPIDEKLFEDFKALIPNGEQFMADRGFTLESYRALAAFDDYMEKANLELLSEVRDEYQKKGYVEMEVPDDEEEVTSLGKARRRFRPGVAKNARGRVSKLN